MLRESFLGRRPSHYKSNGIVKSFIISETFLWSAWNFITPIFAIFAANNITGGNAEIAASVFSVYLIVRVIFELISGRYLAKISETKQILVIIIGMILMSFAYLGFALTKSIGPLYIFYGIMGIGLGFASPVKNTLFSTHLDKNKESMEWGIYDAVVFLGMAVSAALGGFIANKYGFQFLFCISSIINALGIIPYIIHIRGYRKLHSPTQV